MIDPSNNKENVSTLPGNLDSSTSGDHNDSSSTTASSAPTKIASIVSRPTLYQEISKQVLRHKLQKLRHLVIPQAISPDYLDQLFPTLLELFDPQPVIYNGGIAQIKKWKISCYLEVMEGGVPCTNPNLKLLQLFRPLLDTCNDLFLEWYRQQHACNDKSNNHSNNNNTTHRSCRRLMTFITRYTPNPGEQALLKHVDGAGKVDGSVVVALPVDRWSAPYQVNSFEGHGGGITFWDGRESSQEPNQPLHTDNNRNHQNNNNCKISAPNRRFRPREIHYETRSGDIAFIDKAVWHQADPITKGTRWALVVFYKVMMMDKTPESRSSDC